MKQLLYWVTQENSIEISLQVVYLIYYYLWSVLTTVHPTLNDHVYDMRPTCVVHVGWRYFILEPSTLFSQILWSILWLCHQLVTDVTVWLINPNPSCSKNRKEKKKEKEKENKMKRENKNEVYRQRSWHLRPPCCIHVLWHHLPDPSIMF